MITLDDFKARLGARAIDAGASVSADLADRFYAYFTLLTTWNRTINLTALRLDDPSPDAIDRLLIEPLVAAGRVPAGCRTMIDIGSGGGSPAIPMALALPGIRLNMVESRVRKSVFLREAARAVRLNAEVFTARVEELSDRAGHSGTADLITMRAVRSDAKLLRAVEPLMAKRGQLFVISGADPPPMTGSVHLVSTERLLASGSAYLHVLVRRST